MSGSNPNIPLSQGPQQQNHPYQPTNPPAHTTSSTAMGGNTLDPPLSELRLRSLIHACLVIDGNSYGVPARSGIIELTADMGIEELHLEIWEYLCSNKFASDDISWWRYTPKLSVRVRWKTKSKSQDIPDALISTDNEVKEAIGFMAERSFEGYFFVTCELTTKPGIF